MAELFSLMLARALCETWRMEPISHIAERLPAATSVQDDGQTLRSWPGASIRRAGFPHTQSPAAASIGVPPDSVADALILDALILEPPAAIAALPFFRIEAIVLEKFSSIYAEHF